MLNIRDYKVVKPGRLKDIHRDIVEGELSFPNLGDQDLTMENIPVVLVTNGKGMYQPALLTDFDWVNHERKVKFFEAIEAACQTYHQIIWKDAEAPIRRE